jgi:hypothetical protein
MSEKPAKPAETHREQPKVIEKGRKVPCTAEREKKPDRTRTTTSRGPGQKP